MFQLYCLAEQFKVIDSNKTGVIAMSKPRGTSARRPLRTPTLTAASVVATLVALCPIALAGAASPAGAHGAGGGRPAHAARTLNATDTAHLHYVRSSGSELFETGTATGTLPGGMQARVTIGATISGSFTIDVSGGGTISGHGTATPHGSGRYESFSGSLTVTGGSGRYAHTRGRAGLYGTFDRRSYALVIQTTGQLSY
jgi:hypothetical protein